MHESKINEPGVPARDPLLDEDASVPAWEEIDVGRYMPRRIRGSYRGGQLG